MGEESMDLLLRSRVLSCKEIYADELYKIAKNTIIKYMYFTDFVLGGGGGQKAVMNRVSVEQRK
jgi:hypothetical protein